MTQGGLLRVCLARKPKSAAHQPKQDQAHQGKTETARKATLQPVNAFHQLGVLLGKLLDDLRTGADLRFELGNTTLDAGDTFRQFCAIGRPI